MDIETLIKFKNIITNELDKKTNSLISFPEKFKSFTVIDLKHEPIKIMNLIIDRNNTLLGIDDENYFVIGKATNEMTLILFKISTDSSDSFYYIRTTETTEFKLGKISTIDSAWKHKHRDIVSNLVWIYEINEFNETNENSEKLSLYDKIYDEKINNIRELICSAYFKTINRDINSNYYKDVNSIYEAFSLNKNKTLNLNKHMI